MAGGAARRACRPAHAGGTGLSVRQNLESSKGRNAAKASRFRWTACLSLAICISVLGQSTALHAGEIALAGRVVDATGVPVDGVLVRLLGADITTLTGSDGRWTIAEGTPRALFPDRVQSPSRISWSGPNGELRYEVSAETPVTVLMFAADGTQVGKEHLLAKGGGTRRLRVPAATALVGIASQACDRVVYALSGGAAALTFSTCDGATPVEGDGLKDILSFELPGYLPARVPLKSLVDPDALRQPVRITAAAATLAADPSTFAGMVSKLKGGEVVLLADGEYGAFEHRGATRYAWWVTFRAAPGAKPVFEKISFSNDTRFWDGEHDVWICFDGVTIKDGAHVKGARWVDLRNCYITRQGEITGSKANVEKTAVLYRECRGVRIEGCEITHSGNGIGGWGNHIIARRNHVHHCSQDGFHFLGGHDFLCEYNEAHDFDDGLTDADQRAGKPGNMHDDCIQMYQVFGWSGGPVDWLADCTFRGNRFYRPEALGWMIQNKPKGRMMRFLFESNITTAVPGYMFHFKDTCDGLVFRFNTFLLPKEGFQFTGMTGRAFDTRRSNSFVALPTWSERVEIYGNIMGGRNEFFDDKSRAVRFDNNIYYGGGGRSGPGEIRIGKPPFVDVTSLEAVPTPPAVAVRLVEPPGAGERFRVPLPAYDANGNRRARLTCLGAVDVNARREVAKVAAPEEAKSASGKAAAPRAVVPRPDAVKAWDARLQERLRVAIDAGRKASFFASSLRQKIRVESIGPGGALSVRGGQVAMHVDWARLTFGERASLTEAVMAEGNVEDNAMAAFYHLAARSPAAEEHLRSCGELAEFVRSQFE